MSITPMLAHPYDPEKVTWPQLGQPKLDGVRAIVTQDGVFSRTGKVFDGLDWLVDIFNQVPNLAALDGELYCHGKPFDEISGAVRRQGEKPDWLEYHIFDFIPESELVNSARYEIWASSYWHLLNKGRVKTVKTVYLVNQAEADDYLEQCLEQGYEGIMLRNPEGKYEQKRSRNLHKYKKMQDAEFKIVGYREGSGKEKGLLIWQCLAPSGYLFDVRPAGSYEQRERQFAIAQRKFSSLYKGKMLTVQFQELTPKGIPRFPVGKAIRDYE